MDACKCTLCLPFVPNVCMTSQTVNNHHQCVRIVDWQLSTARSHALLTTHEFAVMRSWWLYFSVRWQQRGGCSAAAAAWRLQASALLLNNESEKWSWNSPALWALSVGRRAARTCGAPPGCSPGWRWSAAGCLYFQWCCTPASGTGSGNMSCTS